MMEKPSFKHIPVLLTPAITALHIKPAGVYVDVTFGRGGHSQAILCELGEEGQLIALDRDPEAIAFGKTSFSDPRLVLMQASFDELNQILTEKGYHGKVDGILADLGVSSPQLDQPERGFSFLQDGPLDMRMDPGVGEPLSDWLAHIEESSLAQVLWEYGEERYARRIAKAIVLARREAPIVSTSQLADIVRKAHPRWEPHKHPATRTFQALRIQMNGELEQLKTLLKEAALSLKPGGRLAVITFHSLEDRLVKQATQSSLPEKRLLRRWRVTEEQLAIYRPPFRLLGKHIKPSEEEIQQNPRARSAKLRILEKLS